MPEMQSGEQELLQTHLGPLVLNSPLLNASGAFNPTLFNQLYPLSSCMGAVVTKTVTPEPKAGNPQRRTLELPGIGMLNSIGLQNPGLAYTLHTELEALGHLNIPVILSISADSTQDFVQMVETITQHANYSHVAALELNLSCPNVHKGGIHFGSACDSVHEVVRAVVANFPKPVLAKLTPNVTDITPIAGSALEAGATGITAINTLLGVAIDIHKRKPVLPRVSAGYSGPGIKPVALHAIWNLRKHFPEANIIGVGGIRSATDVLEFMMAGANAVQIGTECFREPLLFHQVYQELNAFCQQERIQSIEELVNCAHSALVIC